MKVKKLNISSFRGFRQATIDFPDSNLAVFIGTNGKGKSSVLDLVAMFLNQVVSQLVEKQGYAGKAEYRIGYADINNAAQKTHNSILLDKGNGEFTKLRLTFEGCISNCRILVNEFDWMYYLKSSGSF